MSAPEQGTVRFLVVLDVDSTLIEDEVIELLAEVAGVRAEVAAVTAEAMHGRLDFAESLTRRVALLAGLPATAVHAAHARVRITAGAAALVSGVHAAGGRIAAVSGGFHEVLDPVAAELGLDRWTANRLEVRDGLLTGRVDGPIIDAEAKAQALRGWAAEAGIGTDRSVAVGDGANDIRMLEVAGLGIAFDAKPVLRAVADLTLDARDLSQVLAVLPRAARTAS